MNIFIAPSDVLLFRDGRPFSAGEGHRARSIFPPTPNTIQGVIRSKVLAERCGRYQQYQNNCSCCSEITNCTIPDEIGRPAQNGNGNYGKMELKGTLIAKYNSDNLTLYFPIPQDVVQVKEKNKNDSTTKPQLKLLQPLTEKIPGENDLDYPLLPLWNPEIQPVESIQGYFEHQDLINYLLGKNPDKFTKPDDLFQRESRYGIEVDNSKQAVEEGKIYQTEFIRCYENIGLYLEIDGINYLSNDPEIEEGFVAIGGENKVASYSHISQINWGDFTEKLKNNLEKSDGFKIYLATPTIFNSDHKQGWLPEWINPENLSGEYQGISVKLISVALGNYQTIGGWDVAFNRPKPTRRTVPPGSVYYFKTNAKPQEIIDTFHWQNLADNSQEAQIGFGLSLVGTWNYCSLN